MGFKLSLQTPLWKLLCSLLFFCLKDKAQRWEGLQLHSDRGLCLLSALSTRAGSFLSAWLEDSFQGTSHPILPGLDGSPSPLEAYQAFISSSDGPSTCRGQNMLSVEHVLVRYEGEGVMARVDIKEAGHLARSL